LNGIPTLPTQIGSRQNQFMNYIGRHLNTIGILLLLGCSAAAAGLYLGVLGRIQQACLAPGKETAYTCSMHPEVRSKRPGHCPTCGMQLLARAATVSGCTRHDSGCCSADNAAPHAGCTHENQTK
jgi:hypothetical protein